MATAGAPPSSVPPTIISKTTASNSSTNKDNNTGTAETTTVEVEKMSWYIVESGTVYLDNNATTPLDLDVRDAISAALDCWGNPSSAHEYGKLAKEKVDVARKQVAELVNVVDDDVIFTSGGTESNNWVIHSALAYFAKENRKTLARPHIVTSNVEHPSISETLRQLQRTAQCDVTEVEVDLKTGAVEAEKVAKAMNENTVLVTVMLANNETGVIQPIAEISKAVEGRRGKLTERRILIHTDAAQAIGKIPVDCKRLGVDFLTIAGHKFYGPRIGALIVRNRAETPLFPFLRGGGQEFGMRPGTENVPMIVGLGAAASMFIDSKKLDHQRKHLQQLRDHFEKQIEAEFGGADNVRINFKAQSRLPNTSSITLPKLAVTAGEMLGKCKTFQASTGAACHSAETAVPSRVLTACGLTVEEAVKTVRLSLGRSTTADDLKRVVAELKSLTFLTKYAGSLMNAITGGKQPPPAGF